MRIEQLVTKSPKTRRPEDSSIQAVGAKVPRAMAADGPSSASSTVAGLPAGLLLRTLREVMGGAQP